MARLQARLGDRTSHGGTIITGSLSSMINGRPAARMGDLHICPIPHHGMTPIVTGSMNTTTDARPNARIGDMTGCGAIIIGGSFDVTGG